MSKTRTALSLEYEGKWGIISQVIDLIPISQVQKKNGIFKSLERIYFFGVDSLRVKYKQLIDFAKDIQSNCTKLKL